MEISSLFVQCMQGSLLLNRHLAYNAATFVIVGSPLAARYRQTAAIDTVNSKAVTRPAHLSSIKHEARIMANEQDIDNGDSTADIIAVTAIIAIIVGTAVYWLSSF